jgi:hypothetical protein
MSTRPSSTRRSSSLRLSERASRDSHPFQPPLFIKATNPPRDKLSADGCSGTYTRRSPYLGIATDDRPKGHATRIYVMSQTTYAIRVVLGNNVNADRALPIISRFNCRNWQKTSKPFDQGRQKRIIPHMQFRHSRIINNRPLRSLYLASAFFFVNSVNTPNRI